MFILFLFFFFVSFSMLIIGLTKPVGFSRFIRIEMTRKKISATFGLIAIVSLVLFAITARISKNNQVTQQPATVNSNISYVENSPPPKETKTETVDCDNGQSCKELIIQGDQKYLLPNGKKSPFGGYADPSIREDSNGILWMVYSWPHLKFSNKKPVPSVDIHLAKSPDKGITWNFVTKLFTATPMANPAKSSQSGYLDYEVMNMLPVTSNGQTTWYGVTLNYFVPEQGGMAARPSDSFHIRVYQADDPTKLATAPHVVLGGGTTAKEWGFNQPLIPDDIGVLDRKSFFWNEPSLYFENDTLYLTMVSFHLRNRSDITRDSVHVFATRPNGLPESWRWEYKGKLAGHAEALLLNSARLTQIDIAPGKQGGLLLIASPDDWNEQAGDYNHKGCVALEIESLENPGLMKDSSGNVAIHAVVKDSQANELGSAACSYNPNSTTGILFTRRNKTQDELTASLWQTYLYP